MLRSYFKIKNLVECREYSTLGLKGLRFLGHMCSVIFICLFSFIFSFVLFYSSFYLFAFTSFRSFSVYSFVLSTHFFSYLFAFSSVCPFNPFPPSVASFIKTFDFNFRRDYQKKILWASRLWVGRRKEPILGYVPKNDEKRIWSLKG